MEKRKCPDNLQIVRKSTEGSDKVYMLKLNRVTSNLEVYQRVPDNKLNEYYSIREDFDSSAYCMFERVNTMPCIYGGNESPTPYGIFNVEYTSKDAYVSGYHRLYDKVRFFGYLVIFEDYFIHSDMYLMDVDENMLRNGMAESISLNEKHTAGCIRVKQENLDWLVSNIEQGSIVMM